MEIVINRFFTEAISGDEQTLLGEIPKRERKHTVEVLETIDPVVLV